MRPGWRLELLDQVRVVFTVLWGRGSIPVAGAVTIPRECTWLRWAGQGPEGLVGGTGGRAQEEVPCRWPHIPVDEEPKLLQAPNHFHLGQRFCLDI